MTSGFADFSSAPIGSQTILARRENKPTIAKSRRAIRKLLVRRDGRRDSSRPDEISVGLSVSHVDGQVSTGRRKLLESACSVAFARRHAECAHKKSFISSTAACLTARFQGRMKYQNKNEPD